MAVVSWSIVSAIMIPKGTEECICRGSEKYGPKSCGSDTESEKRGRVYFLKGR